MVRSQHTVSRLDPSRDVLQGLTIRSGWVISRLGISQPSGFSGLLPQQRRMIFIWHNVLSFLYLFGASMARSKISGAITGFPIPPIPTSRNILFLPVSFTDFASRRQLLTSCQLTLFYVSTSLAAPKVAFQHYREYHSRVAPCL